MGVGLTLLGILVVVVLLGVVNSALKLRRDDPTLWQREIDRFAVQDARKPAQKGGVVFVGGSTIRRWQSLAQDMSPLPVLNRGFGGAQIHDLIYYAHKVAIRYEPRAVVFYAGENDIAGIFTAKPKSPQVVRDRFVQFCNALWVSLPQVNVYFVSIKPPKRRAAAWPAMQEANRRVAEYCDSDERLHFIDITAALLDEKRQARADLFVWDGIHLNRHGYDALTSVIKPRLLLLGCRAEVSGNPSDFLGFAAD